MRMIVGVEAEPFHAIGAAAVARLAFAARDQVAAKVRELGLDVDSGKWGVERVIDAVQPDLYVVTWKRNELETELPCSPS